MAADIDTSGMVAQVTAAGIVAPTYDAIYSQLQTIFRSIYGSDAVIDPDSQDGEMLAVFASALNDSNGTAIDVYNSFSPSTAQGTGLSSVVKVNGIQRLVASNSSAPGLVVGQVGRTITGGQVRDENGNLWNLPDTVTIPPAGQILVTVDAQEKGAIAALSGTINEIATPTQGWQSFVSTADATLGAPVELDPALKTRQTVSTSLPALTPLGATLGALSNLPGVQRVRVYENYSNATDADGIPAKNISVVIRGGDAAQIAEVIGQKKTPGAGTYGTTSQSYTDPKTGIVYIINFFILADTALKATITGTALAGYTTAVGDAGKASLAALIASQEIGEDVEYSGLWAAAYQNQPARTMPYRIDTIQIGLKSGALGVVDIPIAFNMLAALDVSDITWTITA